MSADTLRERLADYLADGVAHNREWVPLSLHTMREIVAALAPPAERLAPAALTEAVTLLETLGRMMAQQRGQLFRDGARDATKAASRLRAAFGRP